MYNSFFSGLHRKNRIALTGLFLCLFLVVHLAGNLQLLLPEELARQQFNRYSAFMSGQWFIKIISYALYLSILWHAAESLFLAWKGRQQGGRYVYDYRHRDSPWYRRRMDWLGTALLIFLVVHFKDFWYLYKFGSVPTDPWGQKDLYEVVKLAFSQVWYVLLYVLSMGVLYFHLLHGVQSAAQTLGLHQPRLVRIWSVAARIFSLVIALGFALIPVYFLVGSS
jgi:succinate dehydrogenase / fumarate reductase cytochrome b subunit